MWLRKMKINNLVKNNMKKVLKMKKLAIKVRDKWIKDDPVLMKKFSKDKDAVRLLNALASVVADYKHKKNS